jgi:UDP-N-acetylglucosamine:LPS N-acetylglucosamine transferase
LAKPIKILLSALDWGNGHAARSVLVVQKLQAQGVVVDIACTTEQQEFFSKELANVRYFLIHGYNISYPRAHRSLALHLVGQMPKILSAIKTEQQWLQEHCKSYSYDAIISDNRYGFYSSRIASIIICHQTNLVTPIFKSLANKWHHKLLYKFNEVWIPDNSAPNNLAGTLSAFAGNLNHSYIGALSRLEKKNESIVAKTILVILSGPTEAKVQLHNYIVQQSTILKGYKVFIAGSTSNLIQHTEFEYCGMLCKENLAKHIANAEIIISRSGYSTIMDLAQLQRNAILIATKGQTEQEYLAKYVSDKKWHLGFTDFPEDFSSVLPQYAQNAWTAQPQIQSNLLELALEKLLLKITST